VSSWTTSRARAPRTRISATTARRAEGCSEDSTTADRRRLASTNAAPGISRRTPRLSRVPDQSAPGGIGERGRATDMIPDSLTCSARDEGPEDCITQRARDGSENYLDTRQRPPHTSRSALLCAVGASPLKPFRLGEGKGERGHAAPIIPDGDAQSVVTYDTTPALTVSESGRCYVLVRRRASPPLACPVPRSGYLCSRPPRQRTSKGAAPATAHRWLSCRSA